MQAKKKKNEKNSTLDLFSLINKMLSMFSELTVIIKDEEKTLKKKFGIYEVFTVSDEDLIINNCIKETLSNFDGEPTDISVKISMEIQ